MAFLPDTPNHEDAALLEELREEVERMRRVNHDLLQERDRLSLRLAQTGVSSAKSAPLPSAGPLPPSLSLEKRLYRFWKESRLRKFVRWLGRLRIVKGTAAMGKTVLVGFGRPKKPGSPA